MTRHHTAIDWVVSLANHLGMVARVWNPVRGCRPASAECRACWAARLSDMRASHPNRRIAERHAGLTVRNASGISVFNGTWRVVSQDVALPSCWRKPAVIFVGSETDIFGEGVSDGMLEKIWNQVEKNPRHIYLFLTKRAPRMAKFCKTRAPLANVLVGISAGDQAAWDERGPHLCDLAEAGWTTFISAEPLIGRLRLGLARMAPSRRPAWIVVGGLSGGIGNNAQPMHPHWPRGLCNETHGTRVAFYFKQWGDYRPSFSFWHRRHVVVSKTGEWWTSPHPVENRFYPKLMTRVGRVTAKDARMPPWHPVEGVDENLRQLPAIPGRTDGFGLPPIRCPAAAAADNALRDAFSDELRRRCLAEEVR